MYIRKFLIWLFVLVSLSFINISGFTVIAAPVFQISITLDSQVYNVGSKVNLFTNITLDGNSTANLAAIEVITPNGNPCVIRTVKTGNVSQMYFRVQILDLYTSTDTGTPQTLFNRGGTAYVNITVMNVDFVTRHVVIGLYVQGSDNRPLKAFYPSQDDIVANGTIQHLVSLPIPSDAPLGQARLFASLFTDFPPNDGYAYCPERVANFSIGASSPILPQQPEYSNITFNLPRKDCKLGNYTVYAVANYNVLQTKTDTKQFKVVLLGDINKDYIINMRDINSLIMIFNTTPASPNWNPDADVNNDGVVNMRDINILILTFQNTGIP
ncbi:MAG TPA: dockerin type I domain-containing protein [Patescibacteria group bacterium]|nr:dockerin type I domain-containing protein [Patescibacteria group bacterium]